MKVLIMLLAAAGLSACDRDPKSEQPVRAAAAQPSFDGADYADAASKVAHGKRLASVLSCAGCHGDNLQGKNVSAEDPEYGDMNAPNITLHLANYSDADFDRLLRHGKPKDGREFWFMPTESFQFLSDADLAALIAYLRTFKPAGKQLPPIRKGPGFMKDVEKGFNHSQVQHVRYRKESPAAVGAQHEWGRQLTRTTCTACHNSQLQGYEEFTPNLDIAGAYSAAELETLLTTGKGKSKPDLGLMKQVSVDAFSKLTPRERAAIIGYLKARAERPQ